MISNASIDKAPRDIKQIKNRKYIAKKSDRHHHSNNQADHIQMVMNMLSSHSFVQQIIQDKNCSPSVTLYTNEMLQDMKSILKHHPETIIGVDRTFNLGEVYITTTVYKKCLTYKEDN